MNTKKMLRLVTGFLMIFTLICAFLFRFRHPHFTETELFIRGWFFWVFLLGLGLIYGLLGLNKEK